MTEYIAIISAIVAVLAAGAAYFSAIYASRSAKSAEESLHDARMPIIVFYRKGEKGWFMKNVGKGPAMNIIVAERANFTDLWREHHQMPPLASESEVSIKMFRSADALAATYTDHRGKTYSAHCKNYKSDHYEGNLIDKWTDVNEKDLKIYADV